MNWKYLNRIYRESGYNDSIFRGLFEEQKEDYSHVPENSSHSTHITPAEPAKSSSGSSDILIIVLVLAVLALVCGVCSLLPLVLAVFWDPLEMLIF